MTRFMLALLLTGCAYTPFKETRRDVKSVTVVWETEDVAAECYRLTGYESWGCATWAHDHCVIRAPAPLGQEDSAAFEILGHEMLHCFKGAWH